ncbi:MAG: hypothetical protein ABII10_03450 [Candidatus Paceibacterota bacterium]
MNIAEVLSTGGSFFHSRPTEERVVDPGELLKQKLRQAGPDSNFELIQTLVERYGGSLELITDENKTSWTLTFNKPIGSDQRNGSRISITDSNKAKIMQSAYLSLITFL